MALLDRPGELVARDELIARLWPHGVVNFDTAPPAGQAFPPAPYGGGPGPGAQVLPRGDGDRPWTGRGLGRARQRVLAGRQGGSDTPGGGPPADPGRGAQGARLRPGSCRGAIAVGELLLGDGRCSSPGCAYGHGAGPRAERPAGVELLGGIRRGGGSAGGGDRAAAALRGSRSAVYDQQVQPDRVAGHGRTPVRGPRRGFPRSGTEPGAR